MEVSQESIHGMAKINNPRLVQDAICKVCRTLQPSPLAWKDHMATQHPGFYTNICDICFRGFKSKGGYQLHYRMYHSEEMSEFPKCHLCGKTFSCESSLACHIKVHEEGKDFECRSCGKPFKYEHSLKRHAHICPHK